MQVLPLPDFSSDFPPNPPIHGQWDTGSICDLIMLKDKYPNFEVGLKCIIMVF